MRSFALGMSFVALAILDFERHSLEGLIIWHYNQLLDETKPHLRPRRLTVAGSSWSARMIQIAIERLRRHRDQRN
jgi:hypothetical protein